MAANRKLERVALASPSPYRRVQRTGTRRCSRGYAAFNRAFRDQVGIESHGRAIALFQQEADAPTADRP